MAVSQTFRWLLIMTAVLLCGAACRAQQVPPPPPPPSWQMYSDHEETHRLAKEQARERKRAARDAAWNEAALHRGQHRVFTYVTFAPVMVTRSFSNAEESGRFRQRAALVGAAYRHHFQQWLGVHAGANFGMGRSFIGLAAAPGSECCSPSSTQVSPSFSLDLEVAPLLGPLGRAFYFAPGLMLRTLFPLERSATLSASGAGEAITREVTFPAPLVTAGARFGVGAMLGAHDEYDFGCGVDVGHAFGEARRYFGLFIRGGVAFGDLTRE